MSDIHYSNRGLQMRFDLDFDLKIRLWVVNQVLSGAKPADIISLVTHSVAEIAHLASTWDQIGELEDLKERLIVELEGPEQSEFIDAFKKSYGAAPIEGITPESEIFELGGDDSGESSEC
tara:strand:+ start:72 stop:431 length:360 start_codon:yes stop_codon:yes gene_type:complete